jgi:hypothetical protein
MSWAKYSGYHFATKVGLPPGAYVTTDGNGSAIDRLTYAHLLTTLNIVVNSGTLPTLDVKIQDSANGSTGWADFVPSVIYANGDQTVTTAKFPQVTTDGISKMDVDLGNAKRYIRFVKLLGGSSPQIYLSCAVLLDQRDSSDQPGALA